MVAHSVAGMHWTIAPLEKSGICGFRIANYLNLNKDYFAPFGFVVF